MDTAHWLRVDELFAGALALRAEARGEYLASACDDDLELRGELVSLLAHHRDDGFLETPGIEWAAALVIATRSPPVIGEQLGRFSAVR